MYYTAGTISQTTLNQLQQAACPTTTATIMSRSYQFGQGSNDNGTVQSITNCRDTNRTQNFVYDSLNRVQQAYTSGPNWGETFAIDPWGNLTNKGPVAGKTNYENLNVAPASIKNQVNGFCNDSAGNLVLNSACPTGSFTPTYSYDAENRLTSTGGVTYTYDGDGKRVKKSGGMLYWTGTGSDALLETDLSGNPTAEYVFFGGRRIARIDRPANSVEYYYSDHLGSTDVVTNATGGIVKESDYYPYGGEIPIITGDSNRYKFNGKERDNESGLDNFGARYNASSLGRFMTPDWAARPTAVPYAVFGDPQSLNLYGYVRNDPVSRADADGHTDAQQPCPTKLCATPFSSGTTGYSAAMAEAETKKQGEAQKPLSPADKAAVAAEKAAYAKKDALKKEYGGVGYSKNGTISTTNPKHISVAGQKDSETTAIRPSDRPKGTTLEFLYHSHSDATPRSNEFSSEDLTNAWILSSNESRSIPSYIGDANGGVYKYTPDIGPSSTGSPSSDVEGRAAGQVTTIVPPN